MTDQPPLAAALANARAAAPPGVEIRPWRAQGDFTAMVEVFHHARVVDGTSWDLSVEGLVADIRGMGLRPEDSILLAVVDGQVVGWTRTWDFGRSPDEGRLLMHSGQVVPAVRGRGIGRALLRGAQAELERIRAAAADPTGTTAGLHSWLFARNTSAIALLEAAGYRQLRFVVEMTRPLDDLPTVDLPAGLATRPVRPEDRPAIARAMDEAMHDHRGWPDWSDEQLMSMLDHPNRGQLDVWQVAWHGDRVVGGVLGYIDDHENAVMDRRRGYTEGIFTVRDWRGRGVAGALIARNLHLLRERGMVEAALSVDTENPSGALGLYQQHGFREHDRLIIFRKDLAPAA
ncbi:MAG TPA: GNAT family N-acetyltransferase [Candidatus Limnocylindrales bacterium]|nr:GNAT family N-acetyltransferase [Candidatus Limnocylindrales bacterium]